mgnify:CR=1 FL=1
MDQVQAEPGDRFATWERFAARLMLLAVILILLASALVPINAGQQKTELAGFAERLRLSLRSPIRIAGQDIAARGSGGSVPDPVGSAVHELLSRVASLEEHVLGLQVALPDGRLIETGGRVRKSATGDVGDPESLGERLAEEMLEDGGFDAVVVIVPPVAVASTTVNPCAWRAYCCTTPVSPDASDGLSVSAPTLRTGRTLAPPPPCSRTSY